ncbi:MAG: acyl-ACP--UDP-N-acetylglucosamine O-acyltransferase [Thermoanaerobaculia bacterium]|nr:acyl-ACP--UDP-N-acetylglucosamine O-acyltransferase [Thermoanaerobaculia bacterium]
MSKIHPTAIVDPTAIIGSDVEIGPYAVIEAGVEIGDGTEIGPHVRIMGPTKLGKRNRLTGNASFGTDPQDLKFGGEKTRLEIGDDNLFREFVTVNRGTIGGGGVTTIGSNNLFMAYSHVAHDCHVGSSVIFANCGTLAGHVEVGDFATIGAFTAVHQFCRVGNHAFLGGDTIVTQDALPFVKTVGSRPAKTYGINHIGLQRKGFSAESIEALRKAYKLLTRSKLLQQEALERIDAELGDIPEVRYFSEFIKSASKRGVVR